MTVSSIATGYDGISLLAGNAAYDPAATFLIQRVTATGGETSLSFSSIPQNYKHLQIRSIARINTAAANSSVVNLQFNSDTTTANYVVHNLWGNGSAATAGALVPNGSLTGGYGVGSGSTASTYGAGIVDIHDYTSSTKNKTTRGFVGTDANTASTSYRVYLTSGLWLSTSAITSIQLSNASGFAASSTFALYGMIG